MTSLEKIRLSAQTWDSDKDPTGFPKFCQDLSALVRCLKHGPPLEEFLDETLDRNNFQQVTTPSYILDNPYLREDYIPPELKEGNASPRRRSTQSLLTDPRIRRRC